MDNGLEGSIPPEIGDLASLTVLDLGFNDLSGAIPSELSNLGRIEHLDLGSNDLSGPIPRQLGSLDRLEYLSLRGNDLSGPIPPEIGSLEHLRRLRLGWNGLDGAIPSEIGNLGSLVLLELSDNNLMGSIPPELGNLTNLVWLELVQVDNLTGSIPPELGNLTNLRVLNLQRNSLTGSIPPELGNLRSLVDLSLSGNDLSGAIPRELGDLGSLEELWLHGNALTGSIPSELGNLADLERLWLRENDLSGPLPPEIGDLDSLRDLTLQSNSGLVGAIPLEYQALSLQAFHWFDTGLCSPPDASFNAWLQTIQNHIGGPVCSTTAIQGQVSVEGAGLEGVTVTLSAEGMDDTTARTDASGQYAFSGLVAGDYTVGISDYDADAYEFEVTSQDVTVALYETLTVNFHGYSTRTSSIMGRVFVDGQGLSGVTVTLSGTESRSTTTGADGQYAFAGLSAGDYTVGISGYDRDVYAFEVTSQDVTVALDQVLTVNFEGYSTRTSSIVGSVRVDGQGLGGVTVALSGAESRSITTGDDGQYAFTDVRAGSYRVTISGYDTDAYEFEVTSRDVTVALDQTVTVNFEGQVRGDDYKVLSGLTITNSGAIRWGSLTNTGCISAARITIGGSTYDVHWTEWQRKTGGSAWSQVSGTRKTRQICGYNLSNAAAGTYRFVGEFTPAGGTRAKYKSENEVTVGGGGGNQSPVTVGSIPSATVNAGESTSVNASSYFSDPDGDALTYTASSSRTSVATTSVSGRTVTVQGVAAGTATIRITATDPGGLSAAQTFSVTVEGGGGDVFKALTGFKVENDGGLTLQTGGVYLSAGKTGCITLSGNINGRTWEYHETWWQRDTGSGWQDVSGTKKNGRLCGYDLTSAPSGKYRAVGDMTIAGARDKYKSENEVTK